MIASHTSSPRSTQALSFDDLRRISPSVFAEYPRPGVSSRYTFVSTANVVELLQSEGWEPVKAAEQRVRLDDRRGFQLHDIRFARRQDLGKDFADLGQLRPELVLQNAHDGAHAYRIDAGLYRLVCRNGLVVADADFAKVAIRHCDSSPERFAEAARAVAEQQVNLTEPIRREFARRAATLRWPDEQSVRQFLLPDRLLEPVRFGDANSDLWTTFNVVQEHLLRGGDRYRGTNTRGVIRRQRTRAVGSIALAQTLNKQLWSLAAEFAAN